MDLNDIKPEWIEGVATTHLLSFEGYLNAKLGYNYARKFISWFVFDKRAIAICVQNGNKDIIGYIVGAPIGYEKDLNKYLLFTAAFNTLTHIWIFLKPRYFQILLARLGLFSKLSIIPLELPTPTMSLVAIGVHPKNRCLNVGTMLMKSFEYQAKKKGMKSLRLSVYPNNDGARKLYKKMGWLQHPGNTSTGVIYYYKILS